MGRTAAAEPAIFNRPTSALVVGCGLLATAFLLGILVSVDPRPGIDVTWQAWMRDARRPALTDPAKVLDAFGVLTWQLPIRVLVAVVVAVRTHWRRLSAFVLVAVLTTPIGDGIKSLVGRPRPLDRLVDPLGAAFPSGHTLAAAVTAVGIVLALTRPGRTRVIVSWVAAAYVLAMALSRTELGAHWLTDVAGGAAIGVGATLIAFAVADRVGLRAPGVRAAA